MNNSEALGCAGLTFRYLEQNKKNVLQDVSVSFPKGQITVLMGRSGCGKSTLAALLAGLYPENGGILVSGSIRLFGKKLSDFSIPERAQKLSMMFQNADLQFCMETLREEMLFCLENISCPQEEMDRKVRLAADKTGMTDLLDRKFATLSGGEKQKAALACIFLLQKGDGVILLDEPFANIDAYWAERIAADLKAMNQKHGMTIIAVDHSLDHWLERADLLIVMDGESHVLDPIPMAEVRGREQLFHREGLRWPYEQVHRHREILTASETEETGAKAQPSVRLRDVCIYVGRKKFRDEPRKVINHSDASFYAGQITALLGPSGAGKTTLFRTLLGKQKYTGTIEKREEVGIVFQNPSNQFITQNVLQEVETGILGKYVKAENLSGSETEKRAIDLLKEFHLGRYRRYSPYMLSQGEQRRLAVLAVLAGKRRILLLDEPTYGQDDAMTGEIMAMLAAKMREENLTIVISTHDARLVEEWADSVYEIRGGKLIWRS